VARSGAAAAQGVLSGSYSAVMSDGKWIAKAIKRPGQLHRDLGIPQGTKIPASVLEDAAKRPGKVGARARLAMSLKRMH
jgi:hypothetical protein